MEGWSQQLVEGIAAWPAFWVYAALFLSAFLENVVPPVPGDLVVVLSAYLVGRGALSWPPVYAATCLGGTAGFLVVYWLGRTRGRGLLTGRGQGGGRFLPGHWISPRRLARAEAWLGRYGPWLVLANRFLSGVRSVIALAAGLGGMGWRQVAVLGLLSMALWNGLLLFAGMAVGENWEQVTGLLTRYNRIVVAAVVLAVVILLLRAWSQRRRAVDRQRDCP